MPQETRQLKQDVVDKLDKVIRHWTETEKKKKWDEMDNVFVEIRQPKVICEKRFSRS